MDAEILKSFVEESEGYLPEMSENISAYIQDSSQLEKIQIVQKQVNTLKGAASMVGLVEIGEFCGEFEKELIDIVSNKKVLSESEGNNLLEQIAQFEVILQIVREGLDDVPIPENKFDSSLLEEEFEKTSSKASNDSFEDFEDFEIDSEMMEVFAMEAEDHLQNIASFLTVLEKTPNNREALLEIRRSAHTLKGSAGIVGFAKLSSLAHRVEDLLDYISESEIEGNSKVFELLLASTECLEALSRGESSPEIEQNINDLYQRFDKLLASLKLSEAKDLSAVSLPESNVEITTSQVNIVPIASAEDLEESAEAAENQISVANNRSIIRVSLDRLNNLVKIVNEMVISRSVFEQRIIELEQQIQELKLTTGRLRRSTNKLEVDFEAQALENNFSKRKNGKVSAKYNSLVALEKSEFDSLEFDRYTDFHQTTRELIEAAGDTSAIHNDLDNIVSNLELLFDGQRSLIDEMQSSLLHLRMVPLHSLSSRLQRAVRVTATEENKLVDLVIENENIEIETEIIDAFIDPLIHILRNAVAHGIEPAETRKLLGKSERGKITLKAYSEGTHIVFKISDDGRGILAKSLKEKAAYMGFISEEEAEAMSDEESYSLIFLPGLSTSKTVNQISGRGLGMNIVKSSILKRQGDIFVSSKLRQGTTFTVRLPMSLAVTRVLLVKANEQTFAFPIKLLRQVLEVSPAEFEKAKSKKELKYKGISYKFTHFNEILNLPVSSQKHESKIPLLLLETHNKSYALKIDELLHSEEVVIKPLGSLLQKIPDLIGATILGNGSVVPVLDLVNLLKKQPAKVNKPKPLETKVKEQVNVLIVDDSPSVRQVNSAIVKSAGWKPILAKDGIEALEIIQTFRELPDIVLTDVEMPRMDGYELLASLKRQEELSSIPVIMITSRASEKHRQKAFDLGVTDYVSKPYEESALIEKIRKLVENNLD